MAQIRYVQTPGGSRLETDGPGPGTSAYVPPKRTEILPPKAIEQGPTLPEETSGSSGSTAGDDDAEFSAYLDAIRRRADDDYRRRLMLQGREDREYERRVAAEHGQGPRSGGLGGNTGGGLGAVAAMMPQVQQQREGDAGDALERVRPASYRERMRQLDFSPPKKWVETPGYGGRYVEDTENIPMSLRQSQVNVMSPGAPPPTRVEVQHYNNPDPWGVKAKAEAGARAVNPNVADSERRRTYSDPTLEARLKRGK